MLYTSNEQLLKRNMHLDELGPGHYYVLVSNQYITCFAQILSRADDYYTANCLYGHHSPKMFYFHYYFGAYIRAVEIPASVFNQAVALYKDCKKDILSLEFDKEETKGIDKTCQYYYMTNTTDGAVSFGKISQDDPKTLVVVDIGMYIDTVTTNFIEISDLLPDLLYYRIDAKIFEKVIKLHDVLEHTLAVLFLK